MTTFQNQVAAEATIAEQTWTAALGAVNEEIADCFERREPRAVVREMTEAMLMELDTRNCWTLAEALGHRGPHRLQHLLSRAAVDHDLARDRIAAWAAGELADPDAVLIVDEKSSTNCVGAARQYSGALGGIGLCQVAVHLTYAGRHGHAPIDRALYLGAEWAADEERRLLTGVPDDVVFATKPQLAGALLARTRDLGIKARRLAGDEGYGGKELRRTARALGFVYALAVRTDHRVDTAIGRLTVTQLAARVPRKNWMRLRTGHGLKGDRHYDWAMLDIHPDDTSDGHRPGHATVLVRRHRYTRELSFYRCHSATPVTLADLVDVVCCRWRVEEDFQTSKGVCGLDQGQTTCWNSWMRWTLISLLAAAVLAVIRARTTTATTTGSELVPASGRELLRLLRITALPRPRRARDHLLHWSAWRRHHQYQAAEAHRRWNNITATATT
ncbi:SRSO17 transposase [Streptomyces umbrinus]|uniref:SRSO17 transposase n=1 Tax=Streptomyces umbrinus TaxID=67370 RepID=A0ABU0SQ69_9ACTN|nr:IS701 family transposase [Streptomyces umbrinus]MDQ1024669.1 SRSO17 transposase [Streptomyces umbrinus]